MSPQDSQMDWSALEPAAVDRIWDAMNRQIAPIGGRTPSPSTEVADTLRLLERHDDAPALGTSQQEAIWALVAAATFADLPMPSPAKASSPSRSRQGVTGAFWKIIDLLQRTVRQAAIGAIAGILVGMLVLGGVGRVFMRIAAMLSDAQSQGVLTENGNAVGDITLGGTLGLMIFAAAPFGLIAGVAVMAVRPWLPATGPMRYLATGAIGFAVAGPIVLEGGENGDYQRFGILGLNICLFTTLPFLFGVAVMPVIDWLDRRISLDLPGVHRGWWDVPKSLGLIVISIPSVFLVLEAFSLQPLGLLLLLPVIRVLWPLWARHAPTIEIRQRRNRIGLRIGQAALLIPCLLGLVLMAQAIGRLSM